MIKTKSLVLNILLEKAALHKKLALGDILIDIEVNEILNVLLENGIVKSKSAINKSLKELKEEGIIDFNINEREKIKEVIINNIDFFSVFEDQKNLMIFRFENNLKEHLNYNINNIEMRNNFTEEFIFDKSIKELKLYYENSKVGINSIPDINGDLTQFIILDVDKNKIDPVLYGLDAFIIWDPPLSSNFPQFKPIFRSNCGKTKLMYVLYRKNSTYLKYFKKYSTFYLNFSSKLRKNQTTQKMLLDNFSPLVNTQTTREFEMASTDFIGKTKEKYNKIATVNSGEDLFGTSSEGWGKVEEEKRNYKNIPLSAWKAFEWVCYASDLYKRVNSVEYPRTRYSESNLLTNKVYPKIFDELKWSCEDFKAYIDHNLSFDVNKYTRERFFLGFLASNEIRLKEIDSFTKERRQLRKNDNFEEIIYLPHIPILSEEEVSKSPLDKVFDNKNASALIYNYGLCNFHRYLQLKGMTFDEATIKITDFLKIEVIENLFKKNKEIGAKYIEAIAKSTIEWEPYSDNDSCRPARNVLNWRDAFSKLWRNKDIDVTVNDWWSKYPDYKNSVLPCVKKFFASTKKSLV